MTAQTVSMLPMPRLRSISVTEISQVHVSARALIVRAGRRKLRWDIRFPAKAQTAYLLQLVRQGRPIPATLASAPETSYELPADDAWSAALQHTAAAPRSWSLTVVFALLIPALVWTVFVHPDLARGEPYGLLGVLTAMCGVGTVVNLMGRWRQLRGEMRLGERQLYLPQTLWDWQVYSAAALDSCLPLGRGKWLLSVADAYAVIDTRRPNGAECLVRLRAWLSELPWGAVSIEAMDAAGVGRPVEHGGDL